MAGSNAPGAFLVFAKINPCTCSKHTAPFFTKPWLFVVFYGLDFIAFVACGGP